MVAEAVLLHEDKYFYDHPGINPLALLRAAWWRVGGGGRGGASTLTMQLARLKYGIHSRSIAGKFWQMAQALRIELHYSKPSILEAYLNLAPYGTNVEGVGAASHIYFNRNAGYLSLPEALTLAVIPQSPARRTPGRSKNTTYAALLAGTSETLVSGYMRTRQMRVCIPDCAPDALWEQARFAVHCPAIYGADDEGA